MTSCFLLHQENDSAFYLVCGFVENGICVSSTQVTGNSIQKNRVKLK